MKVHGFGLVIHHGRLFIGTHSRVPWLPDHIANLIVHCANRILCRLLGHVWRRDVEVAFPFARYSGELVCDACSALMADPDGAGEWVQARSGDEKGRFSWPLRGPTVHPPAA